MNNQINIEYAHKMIQAYEFMCKSLCKRLMITQTSFDIIMFLNNNTKYSTASDIVNIRGLRASLVSMNVDKLVQDGYLIRESINGDRRKTKLVLTDKAKVIAKEGIKIQREFFSKLFNGFSDNEMSDFINMIEHIKSNINIIMEGDL